MPNGGDFFAGGGGTPVTPGGGGAAGLAPVTPGAQPRPRVLIPSITSRGVQLNFPDVPTRQNLTKDQQQMRMAQEVMTLFNAYEQATVNDMAREAKTKDVDKAIKEEIGKGLVGSGWEAGRHRFDDYRYKLGAGSVRPDMLWLSARLRSLLMALTASQTGMRGFNQIKFVQEHMPFAYDTNEEALGKIKWWKDAVRNMQEQSESEGEFTWKPLQMPNIPTAGEPETGWKPGMSRLTTGPATPLTGAPGSKDPTALTPGASPYEPGGSLARPFTPVARDTSDPKYPREKDTSGKWWYKDPSDGNWYRMGG